jgi:hypothetical protein
MSRRIRMVSLGVVAVLALAGLFAPGASAYPPTVCATLSVSTTTPPVGGTITVSGTGFTAHAVVKLELHSKVYDLGSATVQADGTFSVSVKLPDGVTGHHLIVAVGGGPRCPVDPVGIDIRSSLGTGGTTASTGTNVALLLLAAAVLVLLGVVVNDRASSRRRHRRRQPHRATR